MVATAHSTPLMALHAVALDTETTGRDNELPGHQPRTPPGRRTSAPPSSIPVS